RPGREKSVAVPRPRGKSRIGDYPDPEAISNDHAGLRTEVGVLLPKQLEPYALTAPTAPPPAPPRLRAAPRFPAPAPPTIPASSRCRPGGSTAAGSAW